MKKKTIAVLAVFVFIAVVSVPHKTEAAWWRPLSWFKHAPTSVVEPSSPTVEATSTPITVTKTITVHDPSDQESINMLESELAVANATIASNTSTPCQTTVSTPTQAPTSPTTTIAGNNPPIPVVTPPTVKQPVAINRDALAAQYVTIYGNAPDCTVYYIGGMQPQSGTTAYNAWFSCYNKSVTYTGAENKWIIAQEQAIQAANQ